jgi:hypothetical protein
MIHLIVHLLFHIFLVILLLVLIHELAWLSVHILVLIWVEILVVVVIHNLLFVGGLWSLLLVNLNIFSIVRDVSTQLVFLMRSVDVSAAVSVSHHSSFRTIVPWHSS